MLIIGARIKDRAKEIATMNFCLPFDRASIGIIKAVIIEIMKYRIVGINKRM